MKYIINEEEALNRFFNSLNPNFQENNQAWIMGAEKCKSFAELKQYIFSYQHILVEKKLKINNQKYSKKNNNKKFNEKLNNKKSFDCLVCSGTHSTYKCTMKEKKRMLEMWRFKS